MQAHVGQAQRPRVLDQHAEHAVTAGQLADRAPRLVVHAARDEPLELAPALVEDAERRVARAGDLPRGLEDPLEQRLWIQLGQQRPADVYEAPQAFVVENGTLGHEGDRQVMSRPGRAKPHLSLETTDV
jgi:hypothetical protein